MAKPDDRPVDAGLVLLKGKDEAAAVSWWKDRFGLIAAIPSERARAGAMTPQLRELSRLPADERRRLTRARLKAFVDLPPDQRDAVGAARKASFEIDPALLESDEAIVKELAAEVPGAAAVYPGASPR